jgi:very-short-patch-repair endonuclease
VAAALGRKGWQVHTQIGASSFRVDLGVVHPDFPGRYLAGVECDGATYHRSATARDRDKLREQVLRGLGWEVVRIWSTDWWVNPGGTLERVHAALTALLEKDRELRANEAMKLPDDSGPDLNEPDAGPSNEVIKEADAAIARAASNLQQADPSVSSEPDVQTEAVYARAAAPLPTVESTESDARTGRRFQVSVPGDTVPNGAISANLFYEPSYDTVLQNMVECVVQQEGPVLDSVLSRRIARVHGFQRTGSRIQERIEKIAQQFFKTTEEAGGTFYWPPELQPCEELSFRWPTDDEGTRGVEEICNAELFSLARWVLRRGLSEEESLVAMARELGLQRLREASRGRLERILLAVRESEL